MLYITLFKLIVMFYKLIYCLQVTMTTDHTLTTGSVVVWDLLSSLPFQFDHSRGVVYSQTVLMAHSGPCRCVVWCPSDHYFLFTGKYIMDSKGRQHCILLVGTM